MAHRSCSLWDTAQFWLVESSPPCRLGTLARNWGWEFSLFFIPICRIPLSFPSPIVSPCFMAWSKAQECHCYVCSIVGWFSDQTLWGFKGCLDKALPCLAVFPWGTKERWRQVCLVNRTQELKIGAWRNISDGQNHLEYCSNVATPLWGQSTKMFGHRRTGKRQTQDTGVSHLQNTGALKTFQTENWAGMLRHPQ